MESFTNCSSGCSATQNGVLKLFCVAMVVASCKGKAATAAPCEHVNTFSLLRQKKNHKKNPATVAPCTRTFNQQRSFSASTMAMC